MTDVVLSADYRGRLRRIVRLLDDRMFASPAPAGAPKWVMEAWIDSASVGVQALAAAAAVTVDRATADVYYQAAVDLGSVLSDSETWETRWRLPARTAVVCEWLAEAMRILFTPPPPPPDDGEAGE